MAFLARDDDDRAGIRFKKSSDTRVLRLTCNDTIFQIIKDKILGLIMIIEFSKFV